MMLGIKESGASGNLLHDGNMAASSIENGISERISGNLSRIFRDFLLCPPHIHKNDLTHPLKPDKETENRDDQRLPVVGGFFSDSSRLQQGELLCHD